MIHDSHLVEDIDTLLARIGEQIRCALEQAVSQVAVVVCAATEAVSSLGRESAAGAHLMAAVATVDAPLPEERIRWAAEAVARSNRLYVLPRRVGAFGQRVHGRA